MIIWRLWAKTIQYSTYIRVTYGNLATRFRFEQDINVIVAREFTARCLCASWTGVTCVW
jgi:hypothetical protein